MMNMRILVLVFLFVNAGSFSQDKTHQFFSDADVFFAKHITNGKVDYATIKSNPKELNALLAIAKDIRVEKKEEKMYQAFWINAYNLSTIKGIVANYPIKSPLDVAGFFDKIKHEIGGKSVTLNDIENTMLRAEFQEPRFHFVLVCAALSCPPIINKAYRPETLEKQLQEQTVKALNNPEFVRLEGKKVLFSQIMEWYNADFTKNGQSLLQFTNTYRKVNIADDCNEGFYTYDWRLNAK